VGLSRRGKHQSSAARACRAAARTCRAAALRVDALESRRLLTFGELETAFGGGDGIAPIAPPVPGDAHLAIAPLADGRYYAVSTVFAGPGDRDLILRRFTATGALDTSFAAAGSTTLPIAGSQFAAEIALDANGSIVIAGTSSSIDGTVSDTLVARVLPSGLFDTSFNGVGYRVINMGPQDGSVGIALWGSNIVVGSSIYGGTGAGAGDFGFARLTSTGALDPSFSGDGIAIVDLGGEEYLRDIAVQADGKVVGVGFSRYGGGVDIRMLAHRLNLNGTSDAGFGTGGGWREFNLPNSYESAEDVAIQGDRIYIAGSYLHDASISRYRGIVVAMNASTGTTDSTFNSVPIPTAVNGNGLLSVSISTGENTYLDKIALETDGRIYVAGSVASNALDFRLAVAAITPSGTFDSTLDGDGRLVSVSRSNSQLRSLVITADHSLLAQSEGDVIRLRGMLDLSYGVAGATSLQLGGNYWKAVASVVTADDKTVVALQLADSTGIANTSYLSSLILARFNSDGLLDTTFGNGSAFGAGYAAIDLSLGLPGVLTVVQAADLALQPDGKLVLAANYAELSGLPPTTANESIIVARFNANGTPDSAFGVNGLKSVVDPTTSSERAMSVAIDPLGRIVLGGIFGSGTNVAPILFRLTATGSLDATFAGDGSYTPSVAQLGLVSAVLLNDIAIRPNGNVVYVGSFSPVLTVSPQTLASPQIMVAEVSANGTNNTAFGINGFGVAGGADDIDIAYSVALQGDGKLVVGAMRGSATATNAIVFRTTDNGYYDPTFGVGGIAVGPATASFAGLPQHDHLTRVLLQPDGRVVASTIVSGVRTGSSQNSFIAESALWRLDSSGAVDKTFQPFDGIGSLDTRLNLAAYTLAQQSDGKIVLGGATSQTGIRLLRTVGGQFQAVSARYMINGYNGAGTYPTWRVRLTEAVDFTSVAPADFTVSFRASSTATPTTVPSTQLAVQPTSDPREIDLYYTGPNGPASFVWPKGFYTVDIAGGAIRSVGGASVAATPVGFSTFRSMPGDFNDNGTVNFDDLLLLAANYNQNGRTNSQGDATYDGQVNFDDLLILAANYNQTLATPGPAMLSAPLAPVTPSDDERDPDGDSVLA
jgi:uncharacterized delta-60 repeat protein